jgi:two-component system sensor histidine kinase/response regulator
LHALGLLLATLDQAALTNGERDDLLQRVRASAERALQISKDLLEWCRGPVSRADDARPAWIDLGPFLNALVQEQVPAAKQKGLVILTDLAATHDYEINADRVRLGRILSNLLVNAVRYTVRGRVEVTAAWRDQPGGRVLALGVIDTGRGISPEEHESIFEPHIRGQAGKESDPGGSGLGLSVVDRLVHELGLDLEVFSEYGRGSAFHLILPAHLLRPGTGASTTIITSADD